MSIPTQGIALPEKRKNACSTCWTCASRAFVQTKLAGAAGSDHARATCLLEQAVPDELSETPDSPVGRRNYHHSVAAWRCLHANLVEANGTAGLFHQMDHTNDLYTCLRKVLQGARAWFRYPKLLFNQDEIKKRGQVAFPLFSKARGRARSRSRCNVSNASGVS